MTEAQPKIVIIGAGEHARVIADAIRCSQTATLVGFVDASPALQGKTISGAPVLGTDEDLAALFAAQDYSHAVIGIGLLRGGKGARNRLAERLEALKIPAATIIHPRAIIAQDVSIGVGTVVMAGVIINTGAKVGQHVILNSGAIIEHDCQIGSFSHIAPGAILCGGVKVGSSSLIGPGAVCNLHIAIGDQATIGAGSVVIQPIENGATAKGNPARA
jgi:UDP-perosamine 4-acetyltransferase